MKYEILHLKDYFPALGENGCDATVTAYLADNLTEMGRDHALLFGHLPGRRISVLQPAGGRADRAALSPRGLSRLYPELLH